MRTEFQRRFFPWVFLSINSPGQEVPGVGSRGVGDECRLGQRNRCITICRGSPFSGAGRFRGRGSGGTVLWNGWSHRFTLSFPPSAFVPSPPPTVLSSPQPSGLFVAAWEELSQAKSLSSVHLTGTGCATKSRGLLRQRERGGSGGALKFLTIF